MIRQSPHRKAVPLRGLGLNPKRLRIKAHTSRHSTMSELTIHFAPDETLFERLTAKAKEQGFTAEEWVLRLIARDVADYQLKPLPEGFEAKSVKQMLIATGVLKPRS